MKMELGKRFKQQDSIGNNLPCDQSCDGERRNRLKQMQVWLGEGFRILLFEQR